MTQTSITITTQHAFGTGGHPSTALSLQWISTLKDNGFTPNNALDIGCGTGILSISAALVFNISVYATDIEESAISATTRNAHDNHIADQIHAIRADTYKHSAIAAHAPYDLILFNILCEPAIINAKRTADHLAHGGFAIISGILQWQSPTLIDAHAHVGLIHIGSITDAPWETHLFHKPI